MYMTVGLIVAALLRPLAILLLAGTVGFGLRGWYRSRKKFRSVARKAR